MNESRAPQAGSFQQMRSPSSRTRERDQADHARPFYLAHCSCGAKRAAKTELTLSLLFCSLLLYGSAHGLTSWWDWFRWSARRIISNYFWVIRFGFFFSLWNSIWPEDYTDGAIRHTIKGVSVCLSKMLIVCWLQIWNRFRGNELSKKCN